MKISKIACVAILGISLSTTSLFAKISDENEAFTKAFTNQHDRDKEYKAVSEALTELKKIGYDKLATWDDTKKADESADNGIHKKIFDTLKKIGEQIKNNKTELPKITAKDGDKEISRFSKNYLCKSIAKTVSPFSFVAISAIPIVL